MAQEPKTDEATVVSVQYLRALVVVLSVPLIAPLLGWDDTGSGIPASHDGYWSGLPFTARSLLAGLALALRSLIVTCRGLRLFLAVAMGVATAAYIKLRGSGSESAN